MRVIVREKQSQIAFTSLNPKIGFQAYEILSPRYHATRLRRVFRYEHIDINNKYEMVATKLEIMQTGMMPASKVKS